MTSRLRQLALDLEAASRWGGARRGAGESPAVCDGIRTDAGRRWPRAIRVTSRSRFSETFPRCGRNDSWPSWSGAGARCVERGRFRLVHFSIQGDHVHMVVEASQRTGICARGLKSVAARFARARESSVSARGRVLADRCHVHVLRSPREVRNVIAYVLAECAPAPGKAGRALCLRFTCDRSCLVGAVVSEAGASRVASSPMTRPPSRRRAPGCSASAGAGSG